MQCSQLVIEIEKFGKNDPKVAGLENRIEALTNENTRINKMLKVKITEIEKLKETIK